MNFLDCQNSVAYWLDDLQFAYFTKPQVKLWLNNAQKEVQRLLVQAGEDYYMTSVQAATVANQRNYVTPSDMLQTHRFEIKKSGTFPNEVKRTIYPITPQQQDLLPKSPGAPEGYYMQGGQFILCPTPDIVYTMILHYSYLVADMVNDTDTPDVPEAYHELIPLLAVKDGFIKDNREHAGVDRKIDQYILSIKRDAENRNLDGGRMIVETDTAYYGSLY